VPQSTVVLHILAILVGRLAGVGECDGCFFWVGLFVAFFLSQKRPNWFEARYEATYLGTPDAMNKAERFYRQAFLLQPTNGTVYAHRLFCFVLFFRLTPPLDRHAFQPAGGTARQRQH
jgi:hypothetical protein